MLFYLSLKLAVINRGKSYLLGRKEYIIIDGGCGGGQVRGFCRRQVRRHRTGSRTGHRCGHIRVHDQVQSDKLRVCDSVVLYWVAGRLHRIAGVSADREIGLVAGVSRAGAVGASVELCLLDCVCQ